QHDCDQIPIAMAATQQTLPPACPFQPVLAQSPPAECAGSTPVAGGTFDFDTGLQGWTRDSAGVGAAWQGVNWTSSNALPGGRTGGAAFAPDPHGGGCAPLDDMSGHYSITSPPIALPAAGSTQLR